MGFSAWETPPDFFAALNFHHKFTLDAAASHGNNLLDRYCTEDGSWIKDQFPMKRNDYTGLDLISWVNERVFCNPPYDQTIPQWIEFGLSHRAFSSSLLLPPNTSTSWFHTLLNSLGNCTGSIIRRYGDTWWRGWSYFGAEVLFHDGRLKFWHPALKAGYTLTDYKEAGEYIFDYSEPHVVGPAPRDGNLLVNFTRF